jgi:hypothetical protein
MNFKQKLKSNPSIYNGILYFLNKVNYFTFKFNLTFPLYKIEPVWEQRIKTVKASSDNAKIQTVADAGTIAPRYQVMHNGLRIHLGSYYNMGNAILLKENKGIHEPQEEYVFQEVLKTLPAKASMLELGSYWAFYSMWFHKEVRNADCYMVEPDPHKMNFGKLNFSLNNMQGTFIDGFISSEPILKKNIPTLTVDHIMKSQCIEFLDVLHSDIQGYEYKMLEGAEEALRLQKFGYIFISTHSNEIHAQCIEKLQQHHYSIICEANLDESFSWDGLIVAKNKTYKGLEEIAISKRKGKV